ncbi:carbon-phosphorus lyase complex subunit PhnI [Deinococcus sp.]|uniref:carbon-phosphorus lyase complex subunit PhnI n=1 Tax=Deinococcus sp. TaxID=47478 RepID=UPI0025F9566E|nr:carbon-phosphorus lyase complex subunit PhnI [Deinococcus sp.]
MAYVAARGGEAAIQAAEALALRHLAEVSADQIAWVEAHLSLLVDRVMGEASLYAPRLAALALVQSGGELEGAVLLLRAYRSTQPRIQAAQPVTDASMTSLRRVSAAFKDIPGGQHLGATLDYSHRMLRLDLLDQGRSALPAVSVAQTPAPAHAESVSLWLRREGLLPQLPDLAGEVVFDVTREPLTFPAPRAARLQSLARAETGGVLALGYANMVGYSGVHPTVGEVRLAQAEVTLRHPVSGELFSAGRVRVSRGEIVAPTPEGASASGGAQGSLSLGCCAALGWNETKLIAGGVLDLAMDQPQAHPALQEEFVLNHTESVEASGFCLHFKLPHYVTFASELDRVRAERTRNAQPDIAAFEPPEVSV